MTSTYVVDGIVHYAVTNMPGTVSRTSTFALTNATLPYVLKLAGLAKGINIREGKLVCKAVGDAFGIPVVA